MGDLPRQISAEVENVEAALRNLEETMARPIKTVVELAAMKLVPKRIQKYPAS